MTSNHLKAQKYMPLWLKLNLPFTYALSFGGVVSNAMEKAGTCQLPSLPMTDF